MDYPTRKPSYSISAATRNFRISLSGFMNEITKQLSLFDPVTDVKDAKLDAVMLELQRRYGMNIIKTGSELVSEKRLYKDRKKNQRAMTNTITPKIEGMITGGVPVGVIHIQLWGC